MARPDPLLSEGCSSIVFETGRLKAGQIGHQVMDLLITQTRIPKHGCARMPMTNDSSPLLTLREGIGNLNPGIGRIPWQSPIKH